MAPIAGIGYELTQQLSQQGYHVIAGYRKTDQSELLLNNSQMMANLFPFKVDVTSESDLEKLYDFIVKQFGYLDVLINNAGINQQRMLGLNELAWSDIADHINVNVGGAFLAAKYLYPLIKAGSSKKIINISSKLGSIELSQGSSIPYSISKTGLNMLTKQQALEYKADGVTVISLSPGWVRTDMGGQAAPLTVEGSATQLIQIIDTISQAQTGQFIDIDGSNLPY